MKLLTEETREEGMNLMLMDGRRTHRPSSMRKSLPIASSEQFDACLPDRKMRGCLSRNSALVPATGQCGEFEKAEQSTVPWLSHCLWLCLDYWRVGASPGHSSRKSVSE